MIRVSKAKQRANLQLTALSALSRLLLLVLLLLLLLLLIIIIIITEFVSFPNVLGTLTLQVNSTITIKPSSYVLIVDRVDDCDVSAQSHQQCSISRRYNHTPDWRPSQPKATHEIVPDAVT